MDRIENKIYLVTGASSGIGEDIAHRLADLGAIVYAGARRIPAAYAPAKKGAANGSMHPIRIDITDTDSVNHAVSDILDKEGRIDGVINCAGSGLAGALEDCSPEEVLEQFNINTVGALRVSQAVFPSMREKKNGVIVNIGSIGGDFALPYQGTYTMAKAALRKETEVLRLEMKKYGISACVIEPGDLKTGFTAARRFSAKTSGSVHEKAAQRSVSQMAKDEQNGKDPSCVTDSLIRLLKKKNIPACVAVGGIYAVYPFLNRILPYAAVEMILKLVYHV